MKIIIYLLSIIITLCISFAVSTGKYSPVLIYWWILSIVILPLGVLTGKKNALKLPSGFVNKKYLLIFLIILLPSIVRIVNFNLNRIHGDDMLTAYFSATENFSKIIFFSGIPSDKTQWQSQFPAPFFALQKFFFLIFGENLLTVKLSVIPYILIVSAALFYIAGKSIPKKIALIAVILYGFLAISLYFDTLGLIFISGTAIYCLFIAALIYGIGKRNDFSSVLTGISCGFCYLFYMTSFIALPVMAIVYFFQFLKYKKSTVIKNFAWALIGFLVVLGPFLTYAFRFDNYFTSRTNQVSLLTGSWSGARERIQKGESPLIPLKENALNTLKSFYQNDIGGAGGFDFAHQAIFDKFTLILFILGLLIGSTMLFNNLIIFVLFLTIFLSLATVILAVPPPGYHRLTLAFPFISVICALPFATLFKLTKNFKILGYGLIIIFLLIYCFNNEKYFLKSVEKESYNESVMISDYINKNFPGRHIYVAAYPGFGFDKVYYFSQGKNAKSITTGYHDGFITTFNPNEKYVYAIIFPEDFNDKFQQLDPNGKIINISKGYSLFAN